MPEAKKPTLSFEFVLLDCLDKRGEPRTSGVTRSRIQAHVGRKHRAERAQKQVRSQPKFKKPQGLSKD